MISYRLFERLRKLAIVVAWLYFLFMAFMLLQPQPPTEFIPPETFSILHFLAFFALGVLVGIASANWSPFVWFALICVWGAGTEYIQPYVGRFYEFQDVVQDFVGAAVGLVAAYLTKRYLIGFLKRRPRDGAAAILFRPPFSLESDGPLDLARREILVVRRSKNVACPGTLCFPGGGIEKNERPEDAAKREFQEEVGVAVRVGAKIAEIKTPSGGVLNLFVAEPEAPPDREPEFRLQPSEVVEYQWRTLTELLDDPDFLPNNLEVVRKIVDGEIAIPR